jgi:hypothetical protein
LAIVELVVPADVAPLLDVEVDVLAERAFVGGVSVAADGVYSAEAVRAFDPAEDDPEAEKDVEAPAPVAPAEALD